MCAPRGSNSKKEKSNSHFFARSDAKALPAVNTGKLISFPAYKHIVMTSCHSRNKPRSQWVCHIFYTACNHNSGTSFTPCKTHLPFAHHKTKPTIHGISRSASCNNSISCYPTTNRNQPYCINLSHHPQNPNFACNPHGSHRFLALGKPLELYILR